MLDQRPVFELETAADGPPQKSPPQDIHFARACRCGLQENVTHVLRAGDAAQLAAALVWCRERPKQRPLIAFDDRLRKAAAASGFTVRP
jgi:hypothetical protein